MDPLTEVPEYLFHFVLPDCFSTPLHSRGDLRVAREVNVLRAVSDKLHQTTTRHFCISLTEKIILAERKCWGADSWPGRDQTLGLEGTRSKLPNERGL